MFYKILLTAAKVLPVGIDKCKVAALDKKGDAILLGKEQYYFRKCRKKVGQSVLVLYNLHKDIIWGA